ncbi:MAG: hypothetical protein R3F49_06740 [Planctomycetota bacterium]
MSSSHQLLGVHSCTIDPEGRIQLPSALRDELNPRATDFRLMANLEPDGSLCLREKEDWDAWITALRARPAATQRERRTLLFLAAHASSVRCDKTGRVRIPDTLLASIGVDRNESERREVVLVGGFNEIRVWSPAGWAGFGAAVRDDFGPGLDALLGEGVAEPCG